MLAGTRLPYIAIKGNKEGYIQSIESGAELPPVLPYIYDELGPARIDFLKNLPVEISVEYGSTTFRICHNPCKQKMFTVTDRLRRKNTAPDYETLNALAFVQKEDICLFGHYHMFMDETVNNKRFICTCSAGMPFDTDCHAKYLVMTVDGRTVSVERKSVFYDRSLLIDDFEKKGYFERFDDWSMNTVISMATGCNYIGTQDMRKNCSTK